MIPRFEPNDRIRIKNLFGNDLINYIQKLEQIIMAEEDKEEDALHSEVDKAKKSNVLSSQGDDEKKISNDNGTSEKNHEGVENNELNKAIKGREQFINLKNALKKTPEKEKATKEQVQAITDAANALKETLEASSCWEKAEKWMILIAKAIATVAGIVAGATLGATLGPAGAAVGASVTGGAFGFFASRYLTEKYASNNLKKRSYSDNIVDNIQKKATKIGVSQIKPKV